MARKLGYGGLGNTNGARDFSGRGPADPIILTSRTSLAMGLGIGCSIILAMFVRIPW